MTGLKITFTQFAAGHPVNLSKLSDDVEIEYLPKSTTVLIQPMDQGAIATFKAYYLHRTFCKLIHITNGESSITVQNSFGKEYIRDNISELWGEFKSATMNQV